MAKKDELDVDLKGEAGKLGETIKNLNEIFGNYSKSVNDCERITKTFGGSSKKAGDELVSSITKGSGGMAKFAGKANTAVAVIDTVVKVMKFLQDGSFQAAKALANIPLATSQLTNQLIKQQYDRQTFVKKWENQFKNFEFQSRQADLSLTQQKIAYDKLLATGAQRAQITIDQAALGVKQAALGVKQAILGITQAQQAYQNALFAYEAAQIAAARADLDYQNKLMSIEGNLISARKAASEASKNYVKELQSLYEPWAKLDDAAATYTRTVGGSKESMKALKEQTLDFANSNNLQGKYNVSSEELIKFQTDYNKELGRSIHLTNSQTESLAAMMKVYDKEKSMEFLTKMTAFGYDFNKASGIAAKMFNDATKKGITVEKLSKNFLSNLKMAQTYSFSEGVKGLQKMAERATELNMNMQETSKAADKLSTLEGAMEASSNLAVLGGNFAQYSNPLAMMNEALNDVGSLQERIVQQFSDLAKWDEEKGEITMNAGDRLRMKAASSALGVDYGEMTNMVFEKARRDKLAPEINNLNVSDDLKQLLTNTAQLNSEGKGYVNINGRETSLEEAAKMDPDKLADALKVASSDDSDNIKSIAQNLLSIKDMFEGYTKSWDDSLSANMEKLDVGEQVKLMVTTMTSDKEEQQKLTEEYMKASKDSAEFNKIKAEWQMKYAQGTAGFERQSADLQRRQTLFAEQTSKTSLTSAKYGIESAHNTLASAKLAKRNADLAQIEASFAPAEYKLNLANQALSLEKQRYYVENELPLQRDQARLQYQIDVNTMKMSYMQELMYKMDYAQKIGQDEASKHWILNSLPLVGEWIKNYNTQAGTDRAMRNIGLTYGDMADAHDIEMSYVKDMQEKIKSGNPMDFDLKSLKSDLRKSDFNFNDINIYNYSNDALNRVTGNSNWMDTTEKIYNGWYSNGGAIRSTQEHGTGGGYNMGYVIGRPHSEGGKWINVEGGEYIVRKSSVVGNMNTLDAINKSNGALKLDDDANIQGRIISYNDKDYNYTPVRQSNYVASSDGNTYSPMSVAKEVRNSYNGSDGATDSVSRASDNINKDYHLNCDGKITIDVLNGGAFTDVIAAEILKEPYLSKLVSTIFNSNMFYDNAGTNGEEWLYNSRSK